MLSLLVDSLKRRFWAAQVACPRKGVSEEAKPTSGAEGDEPCRGSHQRRGPPRGAWT